MHVFNPTLPPPFYISTNPSPSLSHYYTDSSFLLRSRFSSNTFSSIPPTMAKLGKLTKLKSAIKRWPSFPKLARSSVSVSSANKDLHAVYVGQSRRRYLVNSDIVDHPVFQELVDRSSSSSSSSTRGSGDEGVVIACEVVLFEHLLWMLESAETQLGSMDELVEFYACA